jgi:peptidoglycan/xylan/chitin deacetylase (PgdA/CDA1 family)
VGGTDRWNRRLGEEAPLLDWDQIRELAAEGVEIGSHSQTHAPLTALGPAGVADEAARSRAELEERLGGGIGAFAYPYGDADPAVCHLVGAAGYRAGVTCRFARSGLRDDPMALPRVEVSGLAGFDAFVASLSV